MSGTTGSSKVDSFDQPGKDPLVKKLSVKLGWNWLFIHKMPNVIVQILMRLKYSAFPA